MKHVRFAILVCVFAVGLSAGSIVQAAPVGPGGRIYFTYEQGGSQTDNQLQLYRVDVDSNWDNLTGPTWVASVVNKPALSTYYWAPTSPEILHPRANPDGTPTGGDGSVFMAGYYDNDVHTRFTKVMPDGTTSLMHPGIGDSQYSTGGEKHTQDKTNFAVDVEGAFAGMPGGIAGLGSGYGNGVWHDVNANDDLTDNADAFYYAGYNAGGQADTEIGGSPGDSSVHNTAWSHGYSSIRRTTYTGDGNTTHSWSSGDFYKFTDWTEDTGFRFRLGYHNGTLAVGDVDNNGKTEAYCLYTTWYGWTSGAGIVRMEDRDGSGKIDDNEVDLCQVIYNNDFLSSGDTTFRNDLRSESDIELIQDPATGKWSLLILDAGSSWSGVDGQIMVLGLSDNGEFAGSAEDLKLICDGIETGGPTGAQPYWTIYGVEFDADPMAAGPIPGDANGDGKVDGGDLAIWQQNYDPLGTGNNTFALGDFNGDGKIDGGDLAIWQQHYDPLGSGGLDGLGANVPEPATLLLLGTGLAGGIGLIRRRRMR